MGQAACRFCSTVSARSKDQPGKHCQPHSWSLRFTPAFNMVEGQLVQHSKRQTLTCIGLMWLTLQSTPLMSAAK